jgi:hypothetical protein
MNALSSYGGLTLDEAIRKLQEKDVIIQNLSGELQLYKTFLVHPKTAPVTKKRKPDEELPSFNELINGVYALLSLENRGEEIISGEAVPFADVEAEELEVKPEPELRTLKGTIKPKEDPEQTLANQQITASFGLGGRDATQLLIDDYGSLELGSKNRMKSQPCIRFPINEATRGLHAKTVASENHPMDKADYIIHVVTYLNHTTEPIPCACKKCGKGIPKAIAEPYQEPGKTGSLLYEWGQKFQLRLSIDCAATHYEGRYWNLLIVLKPTNPEEPIYYGFMKVWTRGIFVKSVKQAAAKKAAAYLPFT